MEEDMIGNEIGMKLSAQQHFEMEVESCETGISGVTNGIVVYQSEKGEGSNGNVVFSPLVSKDFTSSAIVGGCNCGVNKLKARLDCGIGKNEKYGHDKKLSRQERIELGRLFQGAVSCHDWELAESLILLADPQTLNDALCIALDSVWFLCTQLELYGITELIKKIISNGAYDFTRAALRTSFLASCVSACQGQTMSLADTVTVMAQRLHERLQECNGDEVLKAEASAKVQKFTEWALKCIGFHSRCQGNRDRTGHTIEIQLQLSAFKTFLDLAGNHLTGKDFTEAFDAACFPLTLFSSSFDPGWASGISATAIQGLLGMLVEGGADNVNQCFLEASRFGSTELVHILLQEEESVQYLFLHCTWTRDCWNLFCCLLGVKWAMPQSPISALWSWMHMGNKAQRNRWKIVPATIWWTIWQERNNRCFENIRISLQEVKMKCILNLVSWNSKAYIGDLESVMLGIDPV